MSATDEIYYRVASSQSKHLNVGPEQFPGFNETDIDECDAFISYN